jgi:hypothetical protein
MKIYQWEECKCSVTFLVQGAIKYKSFQFRPDIPQMKWKGVPFILKMAGSLAPLPSGFTILKGTVAGLQQSPSL